MRASWELIRPEYLAMANFGLRSTIDPRGSTELTVEVLRGDDKEDDFWYGVLVDKCVDRKELRMINGFDFIGFNANVQIAFGIAMIVVLLMYIAFFKDSGGGQKKSASKRHQTN